MPHMTATCLFLIIYCLPTAARRTWKRATRHLWSENDRKCIATSSQCPKTPSLNSIASSSSSSSSSSWTSDSPAAHPPSSNLPFARAWPSGVPPQRRRRGQPPRPPAGTGRVAATPVGSSSAAAATAAQVPLANPPTWKLCPQITDPESLRRFAPPPRPPMPAEPGLVGGEEPGLRRTYPFFLHEGLAPLSAGCGGRLTAGPLQVGDAREAADSEAPGGMPARGFNRAQWGRGTSSNLFPSG